jgi:hypothetical protein
MYSPRSEIDSRAKKLFQTAWTSDKKSDAVAQRETRRAAAVEVERLER